MPIDGIRRLSDRLGAGRLAHTIPVRTFIAGATTNVAGTWVAPADGMIEIAGLAAGGAGPSSGSTKGGGGSGSAGLKILEVSKGDSFPYSLGTPGTTSAAGTSLSVTLPSGVVLTLGNGANGIAGSTGNVTGGLGGTPGAGWDYSSSGSQGGSNSATVQNGSPGPNGGGTGGQSAAQQNAGGAGAPYPAPSSDFLSVPAGDGGYYTSSTNFPPNRYGAGAAGGFGPGGLPGLQFTFRGYE